MTATIGFHGGPGGNHNGLGNYYHQLDAAGIPFFIKSTDHYGHCFEAANIARASGVPHVIVFRLTTFGQGDGLQYDVPPYDMTPEDAATYHWTITKNKLPPEFDKELVWVEPINEIDKARSDWLGHFAANIGAMALSDGYKVTLFGWSSGEPEPEHWQTAGMKRYLTMCAQHPGRLAVSLHEYSYNLGNIKDGYPYKIGRFQALFAACDAMGVGRPTVHITEWGWTHEQVPEPAQAMADLDWAFRLYAPYEQIKGKAIWGLLAGFGGIANKAQPLIAPVTAYMLNAPAVPPVTPPPVEPPPNPTPPPTTYLHARLTAVANIRRDATTSKPAVVLVKEGLELVKIADVTGQDVSGNNQWVKAVAFISRSYVTDSGPGKVKTNRNVNLRVVPTVTANWPITLLSTGVEFEYLGNVKDFNNDGQWAAVALYIWKPLTLDVEPGMRFGKLTPGTLSVSYGGYFNAPRSYPFAPTKKQLHEGLDFPVPIGTAVFAGAAGAVDFVRTVDPGFGYGKTVRIKHSDRYTTWLGHLSRVDVSVGQQVTAGQRVALSGNSGGSTGPHLHWTMVDNPTGLDGYVIDNVTDPTLMLHPAVNLQPGTPPPSPGTIDLLPYMRGDGRQYELQYTWDGGGTHPIQTQANGNIFYIVKGHSGEYEECYYDEKYIYRGIDTSEAPDKYYTQNTGNQYGAIWARRHMAVGETVNKSPLVIHYWKANCQERLRGQPNDTLTLVTHYPSFRFDSGITLNDVIYLEWNQGEGYYFARSFGLVGFTFAKGKSYISEIHDGRPDLQRQPIPCFNPGNRYYVL